MPIPRRILLQAAAAVPTPATVRPKRLSKGDTVALITPSTEVIEPDTLAVARETCEYFGLKPVTLPGVGRRQVDFRASVEARLADLHEAFSNSKYQGVFCVRGGYGAQHLLARIDFSLIRRNPKVFVGYSDITALHLAIGRETGMVTFHGPVPVSAFTSYSREHFERALFGDTKGWTLTNPVEKDALRPGHRLRAIRPGVARGVLAGGNLTLVAHSLGTPHEIDTKGKILMIEDVGEQVYSLDRMLTQLRLAGKLQSAAGIVWGECSDCPPRDQAPSSASPYGMSEMLRNLLGDLDMPVLAGLTFGHTADQLTLPLGLRATLDAGRGTLTIDESATA